MAKIIDNYILLENICQGMFGEIHKGRNLISKEAVAVKTIQLDSFLNDPILREMIINEIQALKKLEDPRIVRMIKMLKSSNNIYLIYEFLQGRNLKRLLNERQRLTEPEALQIFHQICLGFSRLQKDRIVKRNLNSYNVHIIQSQQHSLESFEVKLKNFFVSKCPTSTPTAAAAQIGGAHGHQNNATTPNAADHKFESFLYLHFHYVAPELLFPSSRIPTDECDVFSAGVVLYEMLIGSLPFERYANTHEDLIEFYANNSLKEVFRADIAHLSEHVQRILFAMIVANPDHRANWQQIFDEIGLDIANNNSNNINNVQSDDNNNNNQQQQHTQNQQQQSQQQYSYQDNNQAVNQMVQSPQRNIIYANQESDNTTRMSFKQPQQPLPQSMYNDLLQEGGSFVRPQLNSDGHINHAYSQQQSKLEQQQSQQQQQYDDQVSDMSTAIPQSQHGQMDQQSEASYKSYNNRSSQQNNHGSQQNLRNPPPVATVNLMGQKSFAGKPTTPVTSNNTGTYKQQQQQQQILQVQLQTRPEGVTLVVNEIKDKRNKIQVILNALSLCMDQDEWLGIRLNAYTCGYVLLAKAFTLSEGLTGIFEESEEKLVKLNLNSQQVSQWQSSAKKQSIRPNILKECIELRNNLIRFETDFGEQIDASLIGMRQDVESGDVNTQEFEEYVDGLILEVAREIASAAVGVQRKKKSLILAHYLADISCIDFMFEKFIGGRKKLDVTRHAYFRKLNECTREKLLDNVESKFNLYSMYKNANIGGVQR